MHAVVIMRFHHPVDVADLPAGYQFENTRQGDVYLAPVLADPELRHRVAVTDRTPASVEQDAAPERVPDPSRPILSAAAAAPKE